MPHTSEPGRIVTILDCTRTLALRYIVFFLLLLVAIPAMGQEQPQRPRHAFSIGPLVGLDFMTQEVRYGPEDQTRTFSERSAVIPLFGLQAMYRIGPDLDLLTEPAFGSFFTGMDEITVTAMQSRGMQVEKFHALHLPLLLRKTFSEEALTAYLIAGADMMFFLAPHAAIRYTEGTDLMATDPVVYDIPISRLAIQAGIGLQWQRTETLAITADLRFRSISDDVIGGSLASIGFPAHVGLRFGMRVHLAKKKIR